jgi:hypothetical protein
MMMMVSSLRYHYNCLEKTNHEGVKNKTTYHWHIDLWKLALQITDTSITTVCLCNYMEYFLRY